MSDSCNTSDSARTRYPWYAIRTRANHEKVAAGSLKARGLEEYLPMYTARRVWSDRIKDISAPLFPGYVFCKFDARASTRVLNTPGVVSIVKFGGAPAAVKDGDIEAIKKVLCSNRAVQPWPYLTEGRRIRVDSGPFSGVEGILTKKGLWCIVISVEMLCRSVAVEIDPQCVTPV